MKLIHHLIISTLFAGLTLSHASYAVSKKIVTITQIVAHPALDKVNKGIVDELARAGYVEGKTATIIEADAQGNIATAAQISQSFVARHPDVMVAISTPSAQALVSAAKGTSIPIVFASITDPVQAKLVDNMQHPTGNVTGTRNVTPVAQQISLIQSKLPQLKAIGIVVNNGEENSVELLQAVTAAAQKSGIEIKTANVMNSADVQTATTSLVGKVDAILLLQDNTVASALPALIQVARKNHVPVFTTYADAVPLGAIPGIVCDEYIIGKQTGKMIVKILQGQSPAQLPIESPCAMERL
jgi:putative ABC transport system substrate-binding protein